MSIKEILEKGKPFYYLFFVLVIANIFFAIGRLYSLKNNSNPIKVNYTNNSFLNSQNAQTIEALSSAKVEANPVKSTRTIVNIPVPTDGPVIGSKSGKKYYFPWCGTVKRILPQNQVHFDSIAEAKVAGFVPGGNCKGLK